MFCHLILMNNLKKTLNLKGQIYSRVVIPGPGWDTAMELHNTHSSLQKSAGIINYLDMS